MRRLPALLATLLWPLSAAGDPTGANPWATADTAPPPASPTPYVLERIAITGNTATRGELIRRLILVREGAVISDGDLEASETLLRASGFFRAVELSLRPGSHPGVVVLEIAVTERNTLVFDDVWLGVSNVNPFWGGFGLLDYNFLGRGYVLAGSFLASGPASGARLRFHNPMVAGSPLGLGAAALYQHGTEFGPEGPRGARPELRYERAGGTATASLKLNPFVATYLDARAEAVHTGRFGGGFPAAPRIQSGDSILSSLALTLVRDSRNDAFIPTRGHHLALAIELGSEIFGSSYEFSKYTLGYGQFFPAWREHAFATRLVLGMVQGQTPFFNQFFIGDHAFFTVEKSSLPRSLELNTSDITVYEDLLGSLTLEYGVPVYSGGDWVYRGFLYGAFNVSYAGRFGGEFFGASPGDSLRFPISADIGAKLDTPVGVFTLSLAYLLDVLID